MNIRRLYLYCSLLIIAAILLAACQPVPNGNGSGMLLKSDKPRNEAVEIDSEASRELVAGNHQFAIDIYQKIKEQDGNIVFSPFSISMALAMVYGGARGTTAEQIAAVMHLPQNEAEIHAAFNWLDQTLENRAAGPEGKKNSGFELSIANSIWGQKGFAFQQEYLDLLAVNYGAGLRAADFVSDPNGSRRAINDWVSDETRKKIQDLLPEGSVTGDTRLVLANAIYFNAPWKDEFKKADTQELPFNLLNGSQVVVPMMHAKKNYGYTYGDGYRAVALPYRGDQVAMLIILPDEGNFGSFEEELSAELLSNIIGEMSYDEVNLTLPKFTFETKLSLVDTLVSLGMVDAFDSQNADFSGIDGQRDLVITDAVHKAFIDVNEEGTEAAAATGIVVGLTSFKEENIILVDRPFLYAIFDKVTDSILFFGRVTDPSE